MNNVFIPDTQYQVTLFSSKLWKETAMSFKTKSDF